MQPDPRDPLAAAMIPGNSLGLLGIEFPRRRRNRVNVTVGEATSVGTSLLVDQSFGNCPQYIQMRSVELIRDPASVNITTPAHQFTTLDDVSRVMIEASDTFLYPVICL